MLASRRELVTYDIKKLQSGSVSPHFTEPATPITPMSTPLIAPMGIMLGPCTDPSASEESHCYGCASATLEHCITMLKAMAFRPETRHLLVEQVHILANICTRQQNVGISPAVCTHSAVTF